MNLITSLSTQLLLLFFGLVSGQVSSQADWTNPIVKVERLGSPLVETSPFVFDDHLYLLENNQRFWDVPGAKPGDFFHDDEVRIRDLASGEIVSVALKNHGFGTVLVWDSKVYVFAGDYGQDKPWRKMTEITMTSSEDLVHWSQPVTVLKAHEDEYFFNTAVCRGRNGFVLLYETSDSRWKPFTFRYVESTDLMHWTKVPGALYGTDKYVGGPALYYEDDWYYTLFLESLGGKKYETRITRSRDLQYWDDAPEERPFVTFDPSHKNIPLIDPEISESNASDVELCFYKGKTILYFTGSDQTTAGDLQRATFDGSPGELFSHFFTAYEGSTQIAPKVKGSWAPLGIPGEKPKSEAISPVWFSTAPSPQQLAYQERQLGAFVHFGPATYLASDMMQVPPADLFNPRELDAEQWARTAKSFGAKHVVLTAKHHNGYCLWPTKTTDYSVKQSPWRNGEGDVVKDFVVACRKYDLKIGLYLSGGDMHFGCSSTPDPQGERKMVGDIHQYYPVFLGQLRELLMNYGDIDYLWFDGAYDPFGWDVMDPTTMQRFGTAYGDAIVAMVNHLQPGAMIMGGTKPTVRWSGSEQGWASYPLWNVVEPGEGFDQWVGEHSAGWIPAEANLHTRKTWFWTPDSDRTLRDLDYLMNVYLESIGRGANLLVNMTPDTLGLIPDQEVRRLAAFGKTIEKYFSNPIGSATVSDGSSEIYTIKLDQMEQVNLIVLEENIASGQRIKSYHVEAKIDDRWIRIAAGESIGRKRIQQIEQVEAAEYRVALLGDVKNHPLKSFTLYLSDL